MNRIKNGVSYITVMLVMLMTLVLAAGCGGGGTQAPAKEKVLIYSNAKDIGPLNPHMYNPNQMFAQAMVYEPLVQYSADGKVIPCLAESWSVSADGKEYVFRLRKDVKFSDGTAFNAAAVKKNFDAVLANGKRHNWLELIKQIKETKVTDEHTFVLVLNHPYYPTLQELALIRPLRFLSPAAFPDDGKTSETVKKPVGTGPWVLSEYKQGEIAVFLRNENYWGEKPKAEKLIIKIIPDSESRVVAFEKGEINLIYGDGSISLDGFKQLQNSGKFETKLSEPLATRTLALNSNRGATKDLKVRQALEYAVDKDAMVKGVFFGTAKKADALFAPNFPYCNLGLKAYDFNPDKAKGLLEEEGWKLPQGKEFREKDGQVLELDYCFESTNAVEKSIGEVLQGDCKKVGIKVNLIGEETAAYNQRMKDGTFHMVYSDTWGAPYDPHSLVGSMREPAHADYQAQAGLPMKKELDEKITAVLISTDEGQRQELYRYILGTLHEQAVYLPLVYVTNIAVYPKNITGVIFGGSQYEIPFEKIVVQ